IRLLKNFCLSTRMLASYPFSTKQLIMGNSYLDRITTASFMLYSRKIDMSAIITRNSWRDSLVLLLIMLFSASALANKGYITIESFQLKKIDESFYINVQADIGLSKAMKQALKKGVDLYFVTRLQIMKPRWYWLNEEVARGKERVELSYQALTRQYRL